MEFGRQGLGVEWTIFGFCMSEFAMDLPIPSGETG